MILVTQMKSNMNVKWTSFGLHEAWLILSHVKHWWTLGPDWRGWSWESLWMSWSTLVHANAQATFFFSGNLLELDMFFLMFVVVVCFLGQNTSQPQHACWHSWPSLAAQIISHVMCEALTRMQCVEDDKSIWPTDPKDIADIQVPVWDLEAGEKARHSTGRMWQVLGSSWSLFV